LTPETFREAERKTGNAINKFMALKRFIRGTWKEEGRKTIGRKAFRKKKIDPEKNSDDWPEPPNSAPAGGGCAKI
jgi:hypothetical protein